MPIGPEHGGAESHKRAPSRRTAGQGRQRSSSNAKPRHCGPIARSQDASVRGRLSSRAAWQPSTKVRRIRSRCWRWTGSASMNRGDAGPLAHARLPVVGKRLDRTGGGPGDHGITLPRDGAAASRSSRKARARRAVHPLCRAVRRIGYGGRRRPARGEDSGGWRMEDRGLFSSRAGGGFIDRAAGRRCEWKVQNSVQDHPLIGAFGVGKGRRGGPGDPSGTARPRAGHGVLRPDRVQRVGSRILSHRGGPIAHHQLVKLVEIAQPVGSRGDEMVAGRRGRASRTEAMDQEQHQRPDPPPPQSLAAHGLHGDRLRDAEFETTGQSPTLER